jgi:phosphate starvation-inducible PhoH-like protein
MTRREKVAAERDARFRGEQYEGRQPRRDEPVPRYNAITEALSRGLKALEAGTPVVILSGSAGTGKSQLACYWAAQQYVLGNVDKIILARPNVTAGDTIGLLPGESDEKMAPFFRQTLIHLKKYLGEGRFKLMTDPAKKIIELFPFEYIRGNSFERCIVICEESQNFVFEEWETTLTRLGKDCQMIFTGDTMQNDLKGASGMQATVDLIDKVVQEQPHYLNDDDLDELESGIQVIHFRPCDVVRSGLTRALVKMYYHN